MPNACREIGGAITVMPRIHRRLLSSAVYSAVLIFGADLSTRPLWAAPASCSPTANGNTGSGSRTNAHGTQYCTGGDTGIAYNAKGGDLVVNLDNDPITGHAININDDGNARNITVNDGLPSAGYTAAAVLANDSSNFAVNLQSSGGNIQFTTYAGGTVSYTGASTAGAAIGASTSGTGTITIETHDTVTDLAATGIGALSSTGAVNIWADGNVTGGSDAIYASSGGDVTITTGSVSNPVTIATTATDIHDAVNATSSGGNVSVTTYGTSLGELLAATSGTGDVTIAANGDVMASGGNAAIYASVGSGTLGITTNGNVTDSVVAIASADGNITITANGNVDEPNGFASIYAASGGGNIVLTTNGSLTDGLNASTSGSGTVSVTANGNISNAQPFDSIYATTKDGNVGVTVNSTLITGTAGGYGVEADAFGAGNSTVTLGNGVTIDPPTVGIYSYSYSGLSSVSTGNSDAITAADSASAGGIIAKSDFAPATAMVTASVTTGAADTLVVSGNQSAGINAVNRGDGLGGVSVTTGSGNTITLTGNDDAAILGTTIDDNFATGHFDGAGNVMIKIGAANTLDVNPGTGAGIASGGIVAASDGGNIDVEWTGAGGSITVIGAPGIATGGILAVDGSGAVAIPTPATNPQTVTVVTGSGTAISSNNGAGIIVANRNFGLTTVTSNGPIVATVTTGSPALSAFLAGAVSASFATAEGGGIIALGAGPTAVTSNASIMMTGGDGIDAFSATAVSVNNNAAIVANEAGINAYSDGVLAIVNTGSINGAGSASHPVIAFAASGSTTITNGSGGSVQSIAGLPTDLAIVAPTSGTGSVVIANGGTITGRFDLANTSSATLNNNGVWTSSGTSAFPTGAGTINNSGTVRVSGTTTFTGLQTFNNAGVLDMHGANPAAGDVVTISGAYVGGGKLVVDSFLGTAGSGAACGALSDCLQIGSSSGVTGVVVHDTASIANAGINSSGILLVSGASSVSSFVLDPSSSGFDLHTDSIDEGAFSYSLGYNASAHQVLLFAAPNIVAFHLPALGTAAQNLWYETSPWLNRQADLRDQLGADGQGTVSPGIWVKGVANFMRRDATFTYTPLGGGPASSQDARYGQNSYGLVAGGDVGTQGVLTSGDTLLGGVMAGYVASNVDFDGTQATADYSGVLLGAYGTYLNRGLVIDAAVKAHLLTVKYLQSGNSVLAANPDAVSVGAQLDAGKRLSVASDIFIEPLASFSYLSTTIDDSALGVNAVRFHEDRSARGSIGLRVGSAEQFLDGSLLDISLTGRVWDELDGNNKALLATGGSTSLLSDKFSGVFGEFGASANVFGTDDGWSGFFSGSIKFRNDFVSETLTAGIRYHW
jgi:hypothetical protein